MAIFPKWLSGKKTYIVATVLLGVVIGLLWFGDLTPANGLTILLFAATIFPATFRSAIEAHHEEVLGALAAVAVAGADARAGNLPAAAAALRPFVVTAIDEEAARAAVEKALAASRAQSGGDTEGKH